MAGIPPPGVPERLWRRVKARAGAEGRSVDSLLSDLLEEYANGRASAAAQLGAKGGRARSVKLSAEQRRAIAQNAALARWRKDE